MNTKLTLRLDKDIIRFAKEYSKKTGRPISRIVSDFFDAIRRMDTEKTKGLTPTVTKLKGVLKDSSIREEDYKKYLEEKYL